MQIKLYRGPGMADALRQLRSELGADALILSSRRVADGVEITAGIDRPDSPPHSPPHSPPDPPPDAPPPAPSAIPQPPAASRLAMRGEDRRSEAMVWHGVPETLRRRLQAGPLAFALATVLRFERIKLGAAPLLLVGPPGGGKTLTVARLATRMVMAGILPLVVTADGTRAGATEQLAAFTRLLGLRLLVASTPESLAHAVARRESGVPVLIDAPGIDAFDADQVRAMRELAQAAGAGMALVLPGGMDAQEAAETAASHAQGGATRLVATRLDIARRLGGIMAAAGAGLALAEAGIGPGAADGLTPLTPEWLAHRLQQLPARPEHTP